jgi:ABC-type transporter Mla MlaB component
MIRLTLLSQTPVETALALDGWLIGEDVALLEQEGEYWLRETSRLVLDLQGVQFIDREGIELLKRWVGEGVVLRGATPFIQALLAAHGLGQEVNSGGVE